MQPALLPEPSSSPEDLYSNFSLSLPHPSIRYFRFKVGSSISHRLLMLAHLIVLCMTLKVENSFGLWRKKCIRYVQWSSQCFILGILTCSLTKLPKLGHMNLCWCHPSEAWNYFLEFFPPINTNGERPVSFYRMKSESTDYQHRIVPQVKMNSSGKSYITKELLLLL